MKPTAIERKRKVFAKARCTMLYICLIVVQCGCGSQELVRYEVSGKVTLKGAPAKLAAVTFTPDSSQGNTGPATLAVVNDGVFQTLPNRGVIGGPYKVLIVSMGSPDFKPYETAITLPTADCIQDFELTHKAK
jgi:hypothetical protein